MEDEVNYATVIFKPREKPEDLENIYNNVMTKEQAWKTNPVIEENEKRDPKHTLFHMVAAGLVIICVALALVIMTLSIHLKRVILQHDRENLSLSVQNLLLQKEMTDLGRQNKELTRQRDRLNWTIGTILKYDNFPVRIQCPQKVCKPCRDGWVHFQSNCYYFMESDYYSRKTWDKSRYYCRSRQADLVVIDSREEQEFISNHTTTYEDGSHGYWIGLSNKNANKIWMWVDGSSLNMMYWKTELPGYSMSCTLSLPPDPLANWMKASCEMWNRFICETRALIKSD